MFCVINGKTARRQPKPGGNLNAIPAPDPAGGRIGWQAGAAVAPAINQSLNQYCRPLTAVTTSSTISIVSRPSSYHSLP